MKLTLTETSLSQLEKSLRFMLEEQGVPKAKVRLIKSSLVKKAKGLSKTCLQHQQEPMLSHLGQGHRRIVEGHFKIIYYISHGVVYVTDFFDTRRDPEKMKG